MDSYFFKKSINKNFNHWKYTQDGRFDKCGRTKDKKLRRKHQRRLEKNQLYGMYNFHQPD